jgi:carbon-monoxide dehydrogenase large subunit
MSPAGSSILGTRVVRIEDPRLLTAGGSYVADLALAGAAHVFFVRSPIAHARIVQVEVGAARRAPGVVAVFTSHDLSGLPPAPPIMPGMPESMARPFLADGTVRFVGEPIVAIVAESAAGGADAAELVEIDFEPLPVVVDPEVARRDESLLFPDAGTNVAVSTEGTVDPTLFEDCEIVVEARLVNNRMAVAPIEPRACAALWDGRRLTQWAASQGAQNTRLAIAARLGLDPDAVHVIVPDVGGAFGGKHGNYPEEILVGWLAKTLERPVRWVETRTDNLLAFAHGRAQVQYAKLGGTRDGRLLAYELHVLQDCGAYPSLFGPMLPMMTRLMASGCYAIAKVACDSVAVVTNTGPVGAFRGAGRPEAAAAIERMVDLFAAEAGLDRVAVRRRNLLSPDAFPYATPTGASYDSGAYEAALDLVLDSASYAELRAEQRGRLASGDPVLMGIGVSVYVEITNPVGGGEFGAVEVHGDGRATIRTGSSPHGQGHETSFRMLVSDTTGIAMDQIDFVFGDTDLVPIGGGTGGSRSLQAGGSAVKLAADEVVGLGRLRAAEALEASVDDIVLDRAVGAFHVAGTPSLRRSWADVACSSPDGLAAETNFVPDGSTFPFGAHLAVVDIDTETGKVTLRQFFAVDDAGTILNPLLLEGQIHGGLGAGIAQALIEEIRYDADGNPLTANFGDYGIITAAELPSFDVCSMETPTTRNPLGAKGIGESGSIGSTPAVQNAVIDAVAHLGIRHIDLPLSPERVWLAVQTASRDRR